MEASCTSESVTDTRRQHVSIFLPRPTPFYAGLLEQLRRGFEAVGVATSGLCRHLEADELTQWCAAHRPDVVFEMNRPRRDVPSLARSIVHIVWVVDLNGRSLDYFEGSEITYLFSPGWYKVYPHAGFHRWLGPGTDPTIYAPPPPGAPRDLGATFVGHIPRPWTPEELNRDLTGGLGSYRFADLLGPLERWLATHPDHRDPLREDTLEAAELLCRHVTGVPLVVDERLTYDIRGRIVRHLGRQTVADCMLNHRDDVHFYGPENWRQWPRYAPHHRKLLDSSAEVADVFKRSRSTFHEGEGVHFRSVDAMACGTLLVFHEHWYDGDPGGMARVFEPNVHYVPFTPASLNEQLERFVDDPVAAERIRAEAAAEIHRAHTWTHRAAQVMRDVAAVR